MFLVTGATGNVGAEVVSALAGAGAPVRALVRRPDAELPDGAEAAVGDLNDPGTLDDALKGVEGVFLLPGYEDTPGMLARARDAGVRRIVLLSGGSAALENLDNAVSRYMTLAERAVRESGLGWTFLRPRAFMSNALRWLPQLREGDTVRVQFPDVEAACIDPADIAAVAALALAGGHEGRIHELTGPVAMRPAEQVAVLAEVLGRDLRVVGLTNDETRAELEASMPREYVEAFWDFYVGGTLDEATVHPAVAELTGRPAGTFARWAEAHAAAFR
ncbi:nucleoside-diphosphate sugar epimerase [Amycolatopsis balhimycina DSM 5908]|uniref:Nucleoside-diphosphate sugar epimerase n=1 Tax=Amycolatopsis balhimycina DSM 5908 TaxID=1081091 RepID=A0A428WEK1_AMYBA|nr:NAD(P)H-binding protein [Amycolatopsis balhimycina]RSM41463.1 nucleoside-diphosphate sugar epimerase [Amycolatopsis balhimycina DSM 5908]